MDQQLRVRLWRRVADVAGVDRDWAGAVCAVCPDRARVDAAAITVRTGSGAQELMASSETWATELEEAQFVTGDGPGVAAFASGGPVLVSDLAQEDGRWPGFRSAPAATTLGAVFAFPLQAGAVRVGTLTLYRREPGPLTADALEEAVALAEIATVATVHQMSGRAPVEAFVAGEGHYDEVNIAIGMLAVQLHVSVRDASARLRSYAFSHYRPLRELADDIIAGHVRLDSTSDGADT